MPIRYLINGDGKPFVPAEIISLTLALDSLSDTDRENYRNNNASEIANNTSSKLLIVSGPGTGKSHLFLDKINNWFSDDSEAIVLVTSFVRKLVADLQKDIDGDIKLSKQQKSNVTAVTLHKFARSIVEKNHGTAEYRFKPHFKIFGEFWKNIVWGDVLSFFSNLDISVYLWKIFERQLYDNQFDSSPDWISINNKYFELCKFYNASGFADLILRAKTALEENPELNNNKYLIIDEYQDFNLAEDSFIKKLTSNAKGLLIVGDDEQVLYEDLKSGKAELIQSKYTDESIVNAMLPYCGRCSSHITKATSYFIQQCRDSSSIQKIYLPIKNSDGNPKIQVVACASPTTAVDYIEKFVIDNKLAIEKRKIELESGEKKDAYLLILTPSKKLDFFNNAKEKIFKLISEYKVENRLFSDDYYKVLAYYSLSNSPNDNFTFRKVMYYENISKDFTHSLIKNAIDTNKDFFELNLDEIKNILNKCKIIKDIIDSTNNSVDKKIELLSECIAIFDPEKLKVDWGTKKIGENEISIMEHKEEEEAELEEIEIKKMGAVELVTIIGSKGLSADHVIIIGFDDVNMSWISKNAFYVAITRARNSLHLLTSLQSRGSQRTHNYLEFLPETNTEFYKYNKTGHIKTRLSNKNGFKQYLSYLNYYKTK